MIHGISLNKKQNQLRWGCLSGLRSKSNWCCSAEEERTKMAEFGYDRVLNQLSWDYERVNLINFYRRAFRLKSTPTPTVQPV